MNVKIIFLNILLTCLCMQAMDNMPSLTQPKPSFPVRVYKNTLGKLFTFFANFFKQKKPLSIDDFEQICKDDAHELTQDDLGNLVRSKANT